LIHNLSQMYPVHIFPSYFPKIHSNIIYPSTPSSFDWSLPFRSSDQNFVRPSQLRHACYMTSRLILFDLVALIGEAYKSLSVQVLKLLIIQFSAATLFGPNILLSTLSSNILSPCYSLTMKVQVSHSYTTKDKITVLYISVFKRR